MRKEKPKGFDCRNLAEAAKKNLKIPERFFIMFFRNKFKQFLKQIAMKTTILNQRAERDELMSRPYQQRHTRYDADELLQNPLIKLITGPRRVGKSVFALLMLQGKNFAYLNFDDNQLLEKWDEDLAMSALEDVYPGYDFMLLDEVQNLPGWDLWVSKLYRRGKNLIITGSNAKYCCPIKLK